jgi:serine/threonine protein kinase
MVKMIAKRKKKARDFDSIFSSASKPVIDLLKQMLIFNPSKRITVEEALKHPFL